METCISS